MSSQKENVPLPAGGISQFSDIEKSGYLRKLKTMRKKFFVLRSESNTGPARLEYYDNEKKFRIGTEAKRTVTLATCFNINKKSDAKHKHAIALYTKDDCFSLVADDEDSQLDWLRALLEQQRAGGDGNPIPAFEHVWQVTVKPKGLGSSKALSGNYRLCLTTTTISLVKMNSENEDFLEFSLSSIRRCGHSDCFFFMEVGRQAVTGPGELWMQVEDTVIAQSIHEASLEAMRSVRQQEEMRPRSHSSTLTSAGSVDSKTLPSSGSRRQANTLGPSWRTRCDSMPVPNRQVSRNSRVRMSSEGEEGQPKEEHASSNSPVSLLKFGNKLRPRTSSEGEKGMKAPDSPTKSRGRFSIPTITSRGSLSGGPMRPLSVHRMVAQPMSNSPPIPNSPLSESPQGYMDERYAAEGHTADDHYYSRYGSAGRSRTPESPSHIPIREESQESSEEYMSMSPSASSKAVLDEPDSYMAMTPSNRSRPGSASLMSTSPATSISQSTNHKQSSSGLKPPASNEDEGYMMMGPSPASKRATPITITPQAGSSSEPSTYMLMNPSANRHTPSRSGQSSTWSPQSSATSNLGRGSPSSGLSSSLDNQRHLRGGGNPGMLSVSPTPHQRSNSEPVVDTYCNMEFEANADRSPRSSIDRRRTEDMKQSLPEEEPRYMNVNYPEKDPQANGRVYVTVNAPDSKTNERGSIGESNRTNAGFRPVENGATDNAQSGEYVNMSFGQGKRSGNGPKSRSEGRSRAVPPLILNSSSVLSPKLDSPDYMNIEPGTKDTVKGTGSPRTTPTSPSSPWLSWRRAGDQSLEKSLEELCIKQSGSLSMPSRGSSNSLSGIVPNRNSDTICPGGPPSHHSSRRSSQSSLAGERELNYIDVDIGQPVEISGSSSPREKRSRSPFRRSPNEDKQAEQVNYSTIDFNKSEGLRNVTSNLRDGRF